VNDVIKAWLKSQDIKRDEELNELVVPHLQREEGFSNHLYLDNLGFWTIGYGRMLDPLKGGGISHEEAEFLLTNDINRTKTALDAKIGWWRELSKARKAILVSMAFQMGIYGLMQFKNMLNALQRFNYEEAALEMLDSRWAEQTPARAKRLAKAMLFDEEGYLT
jgi:lysozyme